VSSTPEEKPQFCKKCAAELRRLAERGRKLLRTRGVNILHVDPSILALRAIRDALTSPPQSKAEIASFVESRQAAAYLANCPDLEIDLAIIDAGVVLSPGAFAFVAELLERQPRCPIILTRYPDTPNSGALGSLSNVYIVEKPFGADRLLAVTGKLLAEDE
jgi:hypothetical protein